MIICVWLFTRQGKTRRIECRTPRSFLQTQLHYAIVMGAHVFYWYPVA